MTVKLEKLPEKVEHDANFERAQRALQHFNRMRPNLEGFARIFTGNPKMRILPTAGAPHTDGKNTIWMKVEIGLGDRYRHDKQLCDKRNAKDRLVCAACEQRESMLVSLFHEIAHNAYESFAELDDHDKELAIKEAVLEAERWGVSPKRIERIKKNMQESPPMNALQAAQRISPFLHPLINGMEDARINAMTMKARPGMKVMFRSSSEAIFEDGIENDDGSITMWRDQPLNGQVTVGVYCIGSGYDIAGWFAPEVEEALNDSELRKLVMQATQGNSVHGVYRGSFAILERLRELGFCQAGDDVEPDNEDTGGTDDATGESDGEAESDGGAGGGPDDEDTDDDTEDADGGSGSAQDDEEADDEADGGGDADDGQDDEADDGSDGQDNTEDAETNGDHEERNKVQQNFGTPEDIEKMLGKLCSHDEEDEGQDAEDYEDEEEVLRVIVQDEHFDQPSVNISRIRVIKPEDVDRNMNAGFAQRRVDDFGWHTVALPERVLQKSLSKLRIAFSENKKGSRERNLRSGRVNSKALGSRVPVALHSPGTTDPKLFQKKTRPGKRDYFVVLGLDVSGSTAGYGQESRIAQIKSAARAQAELLDRLNVPFEIWAHSGDLAPGGGAVELHMYEVKTEKQRWDKQAKARLEAVSPDYVNLDGHNLEFYRKRADRSTATDRIIMYYTDGVMPAQNYDEELYVLQRELRTCKQRGYEVVGVGVGTDSPTAHGLDTVRVDALEDIHRVVEELHKRLA